jgi:hypothetical protein
MYYRISNGWKLAMSSFKILKANQQLIIFPILSAISVILIIGSFFTFSLAGAGWDMDNLNIDSIEYRVLLFLFYVVNYFIVVFFNTALIHCTRLYLKGEEVSVAAGLRFSVSRIGAIFTWALVAGTVGFILRSIQERSGVLGKIITGLVGLVWTIATFFVVPVIAYENLGPIGAIKRSASLMKEKYGESLTARFSMGLIQVLGFVIVAIPAFILGALVHPLIGVAVGVAGVFIVIAIVSAAQTIFVSAVYHNVTGDVNEYFDQQLIDGLFVHK